MARRAFSSSDDPRGARCPTPTSPRSPRVLRVDPHVRLRVLRIAHREATARAGGPARHPPRRDRRRGERPRRRASGRSGGSPRPRAPPRDAAHRRPMSKKDRPAPGPEPRQGDPRHLRARRRPRVASRPKAARAARSSRPAPPPPGREPVTDLFTGTEVVRLLGITTGAPALARQRRHRQPHRAPPRPARLHLPGHHRAPRRARSARAAGASARRGPRHRQHPRRAPQGDAPPRRAAHRLRRQARGAQERAPSRTSRSPARCSSTSTSRRCATTSSACSAPTVGRERARTAYELYVRASQLDEDPATLDEAEAPLPARARARPVARHRVHEPRQHPLPPRRRGRGREALPQGPRASTARSPRRSTTSAT